MWFASGKWMLFLGSVAIVLLHLPADTQGRAVSTHTTCVFMLVHVLHVLHVFASNQISRQWAKSGWYTRVALISLDGVVDWYMVRESRLVLANTIACNNKQHEYRAISQIS